MTAPRPPVLARALLDLEVLLVDCQTTGSSPAHGHLLEVAWAPFVASAGEVPRVESVLVALPEGEHVPRRVTALTGISEADLGEAVSPVEAWRRLEAGRLNVLPILPARTGAPSPAVAHFARFERAFLEALYAEHSGVSAFPFDLVCTHEIACRLLPDLPRRGLRAIAGRLGHVLGETKRAAAHVEATAVVWAEVCRRLAGTHDVRTREDLAAWLDGTVAVRRGGRDFAVARNQRLELPDRPGVYRMLGRGGEVLYLGKATSLRRRVNSYFQKRRHDRAHVPEMLTQTWAVDVTPTETRLEAALLELEEIQREAPPYNKALRLRDLDLFYADRELRHLLDHPDPDHLLGPLPYVDAVTALNGLRALLAGEETDARWRQALGVAADAELDADALAEGLRRYLDRHLSSHLSSDLSSDFSSDLSSDFSSDFSSGGPPELTRLSSVLRAGAREWRAWLVMREEARREEAAREEAGAEEEPEEETEEEGASERVERALRGVVRQVAHQLRRAKWLLALSEASIFWQPGLSGQPGGRAEGPRRLLVVERGRIARAEDWPTDGRASAEAVPPPPGWPRSARRRLDALDAAACVRLRVLLTEIRRLVVEGAEVEIRLSPRVRFTSRGLARRLRWL